jgi:hypothetical protein
MTTDATKSGAVTRRVTRSVRTSRGKSHFVSEHRRIPLKRRRQHPPLPISAWKHTAIGRFALERPSLVRWSTRP